MLQCSMSSSPVVFRPRYKMAPPASSYVFPLPFDCDDVFQTGPRYHGRWFSSEITVPLGILGWFDYEVFRPFGERLCFALSIAGHPAEFGVVNGRYVVDGPRLQDPPLAITMPTCDSIRLHDVLARLEADALGHEVEAVRWRDFLQSLEPERTELSLRRLPKLAAL